MSNSWLYDSVDHVVAGGFCVPPHWQEVHYTSSYKHLASNFMFTIYYCGFQATPIHSNYALAISTFLQCIQASAIVKNGLKACNNTKQLYF